MIDRPMMNVALLLLVASASACSGGDAPGTLTPGATTGEGLQVEFRTGQPAAGDNPIEVTIRQNGAPVNDASVTAVFSMPAMPSMNMPEMQSTAKLTAQGDGRYRGIGTLSMSGTWNVRVTVSRSAEELGTHTLSLVAR